MLTTIVKLDVSDDGFLSLMADDGETKDDVKVPDGEIGEKIDKLFTTEEKDTSKCLLLPGLPPRLLTLSTFQMSLFSLLWVNRLLLKPRRLLALKILSNLQLQHWLQLLAMTYLLDLRAILVVKILSSGGFFRLSATWFLMVVT